MLLLEGGVTQAKCATAFITAPIVNRWDPIVSNKTGILAPTTSGAKIDPPTAAAETPIVPIVLKKEGVYCCSLAQASWKNFFIVLLFT